MSSEPLTAPRGPAIAVPRVGARVRRAIERRRVLLGILALTLLTFAIPSAPTYDPWAWILWGREILHLDLSTVDGPSWKPLPVLLTTPFALFGPLAPTLWLFTARAATIAGFVMAYRVARRLGGHPAAGAAAVAAYALAPWTLRNAALGNSEGMLVALVLVAVERHVDGQRRAAFGFATGAALLRPEASPFLFAYGLWLCWRDRDARRLVAGGLTLMPLLWLLPELWGSGDLLRAAHRAHDPAPNSAAFAPHPAAEVVRQFGSMITTIVWVGLAALVLVAIARRAPRGQVALALALLAGAAVWVAEVAFMTSDGFSGNTRYLILPAALLCVLAGVGLGWALLALRAPLGGRVAIAVAIAAAVALGLPSVRHLDGVRTSVEYQGRLMDGLAAAIERAGGRQQLLRCGVPFAGPYAVPALAYQLHVHSSAIGLDPVAAAVVFRARNTAAEPPAPSLDGLGGGVAVRTFAVTRGWRIAGACRSDS